MSDNGFFKSRMVMAVTMVLEALPNAGPDFDEMQLQLRVLAGFPGDCPCRRDAERIIKRLISLSPRHHGVYRGRRWWKIVRQYVEPNELLGLYLKQFPRLLTERQYDALRQYVGWRFGLDEATAREQLDHFGRRPNYGVGAQCWQWAYGW